MSTHAAVVATLAILGAACGLVAVCALIEQRVKARRALERAGGTIIIDGGRLGDPPPDAPPAPDNELGAVLQRIVDVAKPGVVPITFAALGVVFSIASGVVSLFQ